LDPNFGQTGTKKLVSRLNARLTSGGDYFSTTGKPLNVLSKKHDFQKTEKPCQQRVSKIKKSGNLDVIFLYLTKESGSAVPQS
jgi:hypothetical protein